MINFPSQKKKTLESFTSVTTISCLKWAEKWVDEITKSIKLNKKGLWVGVMFRWLRRKGDEFEYVTVLPPSSWLEDALSLLLLEDEEEGGGKVVEIKSHILKWTTSSSFSLEDDIDEEDAIIKAMAQTDWIAKQCLDTKSKAEVIDSTDAIYLFLT